MAHEWFPRNARLGTCESLKHGAAASALRVPCLPCGWRGASAPELFTARRRRWSPIAVIPAQSLHRRGREGAKRAPVLDLPHVDIPWGCACARGSPKRARRRRHGVRLGERVSGSPDPCRAAAACEAPLSAQDQGSQADDTVRVVDRQHPGDSVRRPFAQPRLGRGARREGSRKEIDTMQRVRRPPNRRKGVTLNELHPLVSAGRGPAGALA
jgi:hypothetical protein